MDDVAPPASGTLPPVVERASEAILADVETLAAQQAITIRRDLSEGATSGAALTYSLREWRKAGLAEGCHHLLAGTPMARLTPSAALDWGRICVRLEVPLASVRRSYAVAHLASWAQWEEAIERSKGTSAERTEARALVSELLLDWADCAVGNVSRDYLVERERIAGTRAHERLALILEIVDGGHEPNMEAASRALAYDLRLHHVAVIVAGCLDAGEATRALADTLEADHRLVVPLVGGTAWAWLGRSEPFGDITEAPTPDGATVAIGDPGPGTRGFRLSHLQAREAHRIALQTQRPLATYGEVALEALVVEDGARVLAFVERELGPLADANPLADRLRTTLEVYFAADESAVATARMLGITKNTVWRRLREVEALLGRPVTRRRAELEAALRLRATTVR